MIGYVIRSRAYELAITMSMLRDDLAKLRHMFKPSFLYKNYPVCCQTVCLY